MTRQRHYRAGAHQRIGKSPLTRMGLGAFAPDPYKYGVIIMSSLEFLKICNRVGSMKIGPPIKGNFIPLEEFLNENEIPQSIKEKIDIIKEVFDSAKFYVCRVTPGLLGEDGEWQLSVKINEHKLIAWWD